VEFLKVHKWPAPVPEDRLPLPTRACHECGTALASDQRYCLHCGVRVHDLPPEIAQLLGHAAPARFVGMADPAEPEAEAAGPGRRQLSPRVAALAVLATLAFGSVLGTVISPAADSLASSPVVVAYAPAAAAPAAAPAVTPDATPPDDSGASDTPAADDTSATDDTSAATDDTSATDDSGDSGAAAPGVYAAPRIKHVFLIVLHGQGYDNSFGTSSKATYLSRTLARQGEIIQNYYGATQGELANNIALISGQGPTVQTQANCPTYNDVTPGTVSDTDGQVLGDGCVYPAATQTIGDQLAKAGKTWKAYVEDIGNGPVDQATTCRHPTLGTADPLQAPRTGDAYETWRNPFIYFHSLTDGSACANSDVGFGQLALDLTSSDTTPSFSYIVPNACHDGSETACAPGQPSGMTAADAWLKTNVPLILRSKAYADGGLLAITFDQAPQTGPTPDVSQCCTPAAFPNLASTAAPASTATPGSTTDPASTAAPAATSVLPATTAAPGSTTAPASTTDPASTGTPASTTVPGVTDDSGSPGGGKVGMLVVSDAVKAGSTDVIDSFNHFAFLKSVEDLFGLDHLGYANDPAMPAFGKAVYTNSFEK
jgi:phosphatidylinositol-3-phosphatase